MKTLNLAEFMGALPTILSEVTTDGDFLRVETADCGTFVVLHEAKFKALIGYTLGVMSVSDVLDTEGEISDEKFTALLRDALKSATVVGD